MTKLNAYEIVFLARSDLGTAQREALTAKYQDLITAQSGNVVKTEDWGLRTLAQPMGKHQKAFYTMLAVNMPGTGVAEIERQMRIADDIIRFSVIRTETVDENPSVIMRFKRDESETNATQDKEAA